jgi:hypothetical protein
MTPDKITSLSLFQKTQGYPKRRKCWFAEFDRVVILAPSFFRFPREPMSAEDPAINSQNPRLCSRGLVFARIFVKIFFDLEITPQDPLLFRSFLRRRFHRRYDVGVSL